MEIDGQLQAPSACIFGERTQLDKLLTGSQNHFGRGGEEKNLIAPAGIGTQFI
jgi:hypothetical protein